MKKPLFFFLFSLLCYNSNAQSCLTSSLTINTGYEPLTGNALAPGINGGTPVPDPHWIVSAITADVTAAIAATPIAGLVEVTPGSSADVITPVGGWTINPPGNPGSWISCVNTNQYYDNGDTTLILNTTLSRTFKMCTDDSIKFTFFIADDNYVSATSIDGTALLFSQPPGILLSTFSTFASFTQTVFLTAGTHTINIVTNNFSVATPSENPTGLDLYGTVSSATGSNSLVSESTTACLSYVCGTLPPCNSVTLPDSLSACPGTADTLFGAVTGPDSIISISWSPTTGLPGTTIADPALTVGASGYYYLTVESLLPDNLVVNGDFSAGNTGFTSPDYTYLPTTPISNEYTITTDEFLADPGIGIHFYDHTNPPTGNMLFVNGGSPAANTIAWQGTVPITGGDKYQFTAWYAYWTYDVTGASNPGLLVKITPVGAGIPSSDTFVALTAANSWHKHLYIWNAPASATNAVIQIIDDNSGYFYNDFCLDDISFQPICTAADSIYVSVQPPDTIFSHMDTSACAAAGSITLMAPVGYTSYVWSTGSVTATISADSSKAYWVYADSANCHSLSDTIHVIIKNAPSVFLGNDTSFCQGSSLLLTPGYTADTGIIWSNGSTHDSLLVSATGLYWVIVTDSSCTSRDSIHITVYPIPLVNLGPDTSICDGQAITILSSDTYTSPVYEWSTGASTALINESTTGIYWLDVTQNNCTGSDTMKLTVKPVPTVNIGVDTILCPGQSLTIGSPETAIVGYLWNTGSTDSSITVTDSGTYVLSVTENGCSAADSVQIGKLLPPSFTFGPDTVLCSGQDLALPTNTDATTYLWSDESTGPDYIVTKTGTYWLTASNVCGTASDTITVTFNICDIWFPSAFTPNNDNLNDIARVDGSLSFYKDFSLSIFNRFGQVVFYTEDIYQGWDGKFNGIKQDVGTYFYMIRYSLNGKKSMMKGDLQLIR